MDQKFAMNNLESFFGCKLVYIYFLNPLGRNVPKQTNRQVYPWKNFAFLLKIPSQLLCSAHIMWKSVREAGWSHNSSAIW